MKVNYHGCALEAKREKCLGGWDMIFYSAYSGDGYEITAGFYDSMDPVSEVIKDMKITVDEYLADPVKYEEER